MIATTENPIAAYELAKWINNDTSSTLMFATEQFLFPAQNDVLSDPALDQESEFFGGQRVNALFSEISATVDTEFQWLPYMEYAYTSFNETIGMAIAERVTWRGAGRLAGRTGQLRRRAGLHREWLISPVGPGRDPGPPSPTPGGATRMTSLVATGAPAPIRRGSREPAQAASPHTSSCFRSSSSSWRCSWCRSATPPGPACSGADSSAARSSPGSTTTPRTTDPGFLEGLRRAALILLVQVPIMLGLALVFALVLEQALAGRAPYVCSSSCRMRCQVSSRPSCGATYGRDFGPIGQAFRAVGLEAPNFFSEQNMLGAIMNVVTWSFVGYNMVIMYSASESSP